MEGNLIYRISMSIVVLNLPLGSHVEYFDLLVLRTGCQTCAIRIELRIVDYS